MNSIDNERPDNFIKNIIIEDIKNNKNNGKVITRFPPEPNGYLHIGHAKSICINFGLALEFNSRCHLRFDDTNPVKEDIEYIESIKEDIKWLGFDWGEHLYYTSDYFDILYEYAVQLVKKDAAYVDSLSAEEIKEYRGTLTQPGKTSPCRNRTVEENLELLEKMKNGDFEEGDAVLRAKIDMEHPCLKMRDPVIYRIKKADHHRTGSKWCIYPMYDFAHGYSDSIEGITHSICTMEFDDHRILYDWFIDQLDIHHPQQIEFSRLNLSYTVMSKRKLLQLVKENHVTGWDDPRMPTISGLRRRGYTPESIRNFCDKIGVTRSHNVVEIAVLEHCLREDLNKKADRVMVVLQPVKLIIDNYPEEKVEYLDAENNPEDPGAGSRKIPFSKVLYIEKDDFKENPPKKFFRLSPGREVRLKHGYYVKCESVVKDEKTGEILEIHCTYDPKTKGGWSNDGRKVRGTIHWVSAAHAVDIEVRQYDRLFKTRIPEPEDENTSFIDNLNENSLEILNSCKAEPGLLSAKPGDKYQFLRIGYFCVDSRDSIEGKPVFNRTVSLKDSWAKIEKKFS